MSAVARAVAIGPVAAGSRASNYGRGVARIAFRTQGDRTVLADLYQKDPLRVMFPSPAPDDLSTAVLVTTSGGLVGGDSLDCRITLDRSSRAVVTAQAAEKVYRSAGPDTRLDFELEVGADAWLEWLPQETILFDGSRLRRRTRIDIHGAGRLLGGEILVCGRTAHGERLREGRVHDRWDVRVDGRLAWVDALRLEGDLQAQLRRPAGFDGAHVLGTIVYVGADAGAQMEAVRAAVPNHRTLRVGATCVGGILLVRLLGLDALQLRRVFADLWAALRAEVAGLPARLPRLWAL